MQDILEAARNAAIEHMWANPHLDRQFIFRPSRLTRIGGIRGSFRKSFSTIYAPNLDDNYVLYEMGQLDPRLLGLHGEYQQWVRLDKICERQKAVIFGYMDYRIIDASSIYIRRTQNRNLIIALAVSPNKKFLNEQETFNLRFYSNTWFATPEGMNSEGIKVVSGIMGSTINEPTVMQAWNEWRAKPEGHTWAFVNGFYYDKLTPTLFETGDTVQVMYDSSIRSYFDTPLDDTISFKSQIDGKRKVVVTTPDDEYGITYHDDVDFMICNTATNGVLDFTKGVYYGRERISDVRQVTERDWALDSRRIVDAVVEQEGKVEYTGAFVRTFVRHSDNPDPKTYNFNLTNDIWHLDQETRKLLLSGTSGVIDLWRADNLESSAFMRWLSARAEDLTVPHEVMSFYGMNYYLETAHYNEDDGSFKMPVTMKSGGTVAKIDADGKLIDVVTLIPSGWGEELSFGTDVKKIICYPGEKVSTFDGLDEVSEFNTDMESEWNEVFMYKGQDDIEYQIAKEDVHFTKSNGRVLWSPAYSDNSRLKRNAGKHVYLRKTISRSAVGLPFHIIGNGSDTASGYGFAKYDVWLNDKKLVYGVDFQVDFPNMTILNYEYLEPGVNTATVTIIGYGVPPEAEIENWGFVENRVISNNTEFDLDLYRNKDISIDGFLVDERTLAFSEGYKGDLNTTGELDANHREGAIYSLARPVSFISTQVQKELGVNRERSIEKDLVLQNYLSKYFTQVEQPNSNFIPYKHSLVSAFFRKIVEEVVFNKTIKVTRSTYSPTGVGLLLREVMSFYENDISKLDVKETYVEIRPHALQSKLIVSPEEYNFFVEVSKIYFDDRVTISDFFII